MREVTILEKMYRNRRGARKGLDEMLGDLLEIDARIASVSSTERDWVTLRLEGNEEETAAKYLTSKYGTLSKLGELQAGDMRRGKIIDLGRVGYGIYVDIGVEDSDGTPVDALLPAFSLRKHLGARGSISVRRISGRLGLMDYFPLDLRIFSLGVKERKIEARLTNSQARRLSRGRNRFYVCGETRRKIKSAIQRTGNSESIVRVKRLGLLESEVQCSKAADPREIVRQIGPMLDAEIAIPVGL